MNTDKILSYFVGTLLTAAVGLVSSSVFTRIFNKVEYGNYSLVMSFILTANVFTNQWIQQAINRYLPIQRKEKDVQRIKNTIVFGMCIESTVLLLLSAAALPIAFACLDRQWRPMVLPAAVYLIFANVYCILGVVLQAEMRARSYSLLNTSNAALKLLVSVGAVVYISRSVSSLFWAAALSVFLFIPAFWKKAELASPARVIREFPIQDYFSGLKDFARYGIPMTVWYISANILSIGDRYILQSFRGAGEVGIYAANYNLVSTAAGLMAMPVLLTAHPFLMKAWGMGDKEAAGKWLGRIVEGVVCFGGLLSVLTWVFSKDLASWFLGPEFREGHVIMPVVVAGVVFWQMGMYSQKPMEFVKATNSLIVLCFGSALINVISNLILVPRYGYIAAAYTTLASYAIYFISSFYAGNRILSWRIDAVSALTGIAAIVGLFSMVAVARNHWDGIFRPAMSLAITMAVCAAISVLYTFHVLSRLRRPM